MKKRVPRFLILEDLEKKGNIKKKSILLRTVYQPRAQIEEKKEWWDKIEKMLLLIASTFTGTIILAGDTNINVSKLSRP